MIYIAFEDTYFFLHKLLYEKNNQYYFINTVYKYNPVKQFWHAQLYSNKKIDFEEMAIDGELTLEQQQILKSQGIEPFSYINTFEIEDKPFMSVDEFCDLFEQDYERWLDYVLLKNDVLE